MSGTKIGGIHARDTNLKREPGFYKRIGSMGGKAGTTGGFWYTKNVLGDVGKVREAGSRGGLNSTRRGIKNGQAGNPASRVIHESSDQWPERQNNEAIFNFHKEAPYRKKHWWNR